MKKIITIAALITISAAFFSCSSLKEIPEDKTSAQIIQMGQNYLGNADFKSAEFCYNTVIERFGSDPAIYVEGKYELGRVYLARHKYEKAYVVFTELLDLYDHYPAMLPGAYKKLCNISISQIPEIKLQEIKAKLEAEANNKTEASAAPAEPAAATIPAAAPAPEAKPADEADTEVEAVEETVSSAETEEESAE